MKLVWTAALSLLALNAAQAQTSRLTVLGPLYGGVSSYSAGINDSGQVAGYSMGSNGYTAAVWPGNGGVVSLGTLGGTSSFSYAINNAGQVVGASNIADNSGAHAILYGPWTVSSNSPGSDLGTLGGSGSSAQAINNAGQVVGWSSTSGNATIHATLWSNGGITDLGSLGGNPSLSFSHAFGINDKGQVVGDSNAYPIVLDHATLWSNGHITDLGTLGGANSTALSINNNGQVAGEAQTSVGAYHAFLWSNGAIIDLGTLGGANSYAHAINNAGEVVGTSDTSLGERAFIESEGAGMVDLNNFLDADSKNAGWVLTDAMGINNQGQVTGEATNTLTNQQRAYVLSLPATAAVPEPESYALAFVGLAVIFGAVRRSTNTQPGSGHLSVNAS
ncbi:MAG: DUF3466 family protein [Burkholderiales bacterium]|nr:MAG: DUF3466 family protein [Burkholderiales bacterium]